MTEPVDQLAARAAAADRGETLAAPPPGAAPGEGLPPAGFDYSVWAGMAVYGGNVLRTMLPDRIRSHWTDERLADLGNALVHCARHYKWEFDPMHPLAHLGVAAFPLLWPIAAPIAEPYLKMLKAPDAAAPTKPAGDASTGNASAPIVEPPRPPAGPVTAAAAMAQVSDAPNVTAIDVKAATFRTPNGKSAPLETEPVQ